MCSGLDFVPEAVEVVERRGVCGRDTGRAAARALSSASGSSSSTAPEAVLADEGVVRRSTSWTWLFVLCLCQGERVLSLFDDKQQAGPEPGKVTSLDSASSRH